MKLSQPMARVVGLSFAVALAVPAAGQTTTDDLKKEIDSLRGRCSRRSRRTSRRSRGCWRGRRRRLLRPRGRDDFGNSPIKGERTAKLTLVEFSDYQ